MSNIECAFFATLARDAELKTSKAGKEYLNIGGRIGTGDDVQWIQIRSFDPDAIANAAKFTKGCSVYCEGTIRLDKWTAQDGTERHGLSCMARLTRLPQIGANKPQTQRRDGDGVPAVNARPARAHDDMDEGIPF
jgi:single-stranded DNA-binding protein